MLNAPPSRYQIVEKGGRLIVYDRGVQVSSGALSGPKRPPSTSALNPINAAKATVLQASTPFSDIKPFPLLLLDQAGLGLIRLMSKGTDTSGNIILTFETNSGLKKTINTTLVSRKEASLLGRGALLLVAATILLLVGISSGSGFAMLILSLIASVAFATAFVGSGPTWSDLKWEKA